MINIDRMKNKLVFKNQIWTFSNEPEINIDLVYQHWSILKKYWSNGFLRRIVAILIDTFFFKSTLQKRVRDSINDEQRWNYIDLRNLISNHRWKAMINVVNGDSWSIFVAYWSTLWLKFNIDASLMQRRSTLRLENDFSTAAKVD